jgi:hypothetical protein
MGLEGACELPPRDPWSPEKCWVPHISLVFREMWDTNAPSL